MLEPVTLPIGEPQRLTGRSFGPGVAALRLAQVGCRVSALADEVGSSVLVATPPSWRPDLTRPADLVEEVARLEGYDTIPVLRTRRRDQGCNHGSSGPARWLPTWPRPV